MENRILKTLIMMELKAINILKLTRKQQLETLRIRNQDDIRISMYNDHLISEEEHFKWIDSLKSNQNLFLSIINKDETVIGSVNTIGFDRKHLKTDWGFYISSDFRNGGLTAFIEYQFINYIFDQLGIEKLNCEVIETNDKIVSLHKKFGFLEEGFRDSNIIKNGERIGVFFFRT